MNDCYHSVFNRRKESSLEELDLPSLSYRYAALKVRGCDPGDRVLRGIIQATSTGRAPALYSS